MSDGNTRDDYDDEDEVDGNRIDGNQRDDRDDAPLGGDTAVAVLEYVVRELVDDPDAVTVDAVHGRRGPTLEVAVGPGDMGRVIGRRGRMANAIRSVVRAAAAKDGTEVDVDFVD